jgi:hypothetical protein
LIRYGEIGTGTRGCVAAHRSPDEGLPVAKSELLP